MTCRRPGRNRCPDTRGAAGSMSPPPRRRPGPAGRHRIPSAMAMTEAPGSSAATNASMSPPVQKFGPSPVSRTRRPPGGVTQRLGGLADRLAVQGRAVLGRGDHAVQHSAAPPHKGCHVLMRPALPIRNRSGPHDSLLHGCPMGIRPDLIPFCNPGDERPFSGYRPPWTLRGASRPTQKE
jgi:hypothetical protein